VHDNIRVGGGGLLEGTSKRGVQDRRQSQEKEVLVKERGEIKLNRKKPRKTISSNLKDTSTQKGKGRKEGEECSKKRLKRSVVGAEDEVTRVFLRRIKFSPNKNIELRIGNVPHRMERADRNTIPVTSEKEREAQGGAILDVL